MSEISAVTITAPNEGWLTSFVNDLLNAHLCASVHIDRIRSTYWWSGQINNRHEYRAVLHTRTSLIPKIIAATNATHPYEVPGLTTTPIANGNPDYLAWVLAETCDHEQQ